MSLGGKLASIRKGIGKCFESQRLKKNLEKSILEERSVSGELARKILRYGENIFFL